MMTNARVNVLCKMKAEGLGGAQPHQLQNLDKD